MPMLPTETPDTRQDSSAFTILELTVANHPGVLSHVCNLFARRAFNLEGVLCLPVGDGAESRIWLRINQDQRLDQVINQIDKLWDVHRVRTGGPQPLLFKAFEDFFPGAPERRE